tara:strand:- start:110 stop:724 length:615 start_codon:yes stop_codon:yes gene_type:complete
MDEIKYVKNVYNNIAEHFNVTRSYEWPWISNYLNNLEINSNILDIGCGTGRNMLKKNLNFTGIDSSIEFIKICLLKKLNVIEGDMCDLPFKNNTYDAIISIASFHHLSTNERRISALKEMYRVLKPGGTILISIWSLKQPQKTKRKFDKYGDTIVKWTKYNDIYDRYYYIFKISEITDLFKSCHFKINSHTWECGNEIFELFKC